MLLDLIKLLLGTVFGTIRGIFKYDVTKEPKIVGEYEKRSIGLVKNLIISFLSFILMIWVLITLSVIDDNKRLYTKCKEIYTTCPKSKNKAETNCTCVGKIITK
jgi:hypothetical protein